MATKPIDQPRGTIVEVAQSKALDFLFHFHQLECSKSQRLLKSGKSGPENGPAFWLGNQSKTNL